MEKVKIICYANLNDINSSKEISDEHMTAFFKKYFENSFSEIVDVVIDRYRESTPLFVRDGWKKVLQSAEENETKNIFVPSITMLSCDAIGAMQTIRQIKRELGIDFSFVYEEINTRNPDFDTALQIYALIMLERERLESNRSKMRTVFLEATGIVGEPSAIPILIESGLHYQGKKKANEYGLYIEDIIHDFLRFVADPGNAEIYDSYMNGNTPKQNNKLIYYHQ